MAEDCVDMNCEDPTPICLNGECVECSHDDGDEMFDKYVFCACLTFLSTLNFPDCGEGGHCSEVTHHCE